LKFQPWTLSHGEVSLSALYYTGREANPDGATPAGQGDGWSVGLSSALFGKRLDLAAELSHARIDGAGDAAATGEGAANAVGLRGGYDLLRQARLIDLPLSLRLDGGWERLGGDYASMANPGLAVDRDSLFAVGRLGWGGLGSTLSLRRDQSNVDRRPDRPVDRTHSLDVDARYDVGRDLLAAAVPGGLPAEWLGSPFVTFGGHAGRGERLVAPDDYDGAEPVRHSRRGYLGIGSDFGDWNAELRHLRSRNTDSTVGAGGSAEAVTDLTTRWQAGQGLQLSVGARFRTIDDAASTDGEHAYGGQLGIKATVIPGHLTVAMDYATDLRRQSDAAPEYHRISGEVGWQFVQANTRRPGIALALRGAGELNPDGGASRDRYEVFTTLRLTAPAEPRRAASQDL
jgi:hypothetical protein